MAGTRGMTGNVTSLGIGDGGKKIRGVKKPVNLNTVHIHTKAFKLLVVKMSVNEVVVACHIFYNSHQLNSSLFFSSLISLLSRVYTMQVGSRGSTRGDARADVSCKLQHVNVAERVRSESRKTRAKVGPVELWSELGARVWESKWHRRESGVNTTKKFVQIDEQQEVLWSFKHAYYKNKNAWRTAEVVLSEGCGVSVGEVKNKIRTVRRCTYEQEWGKVAGSRKIGTFPVNHQHY
jgi:hypothetical protein